MNILIVDTDLSIQEYYRNLLESEFSGVSISFRRDGKSARQQASTTHFDLILTEGRIVDDDYFEYLKSLAKTGSVVIVVSSEHSERFVIECIRSGASDFISKRNIKLGYLKELIKRSLLENNVAAVIARSGKEVEYERMNQQVRSYLQQEELERRRNMIGRGIMPNKDTPLIEGNTYDVIFIYTHLYFPPEQVSQLGDDLAASIRSVIMRKIAAIPEKYEGRMWTMKDDAVFFAFTGPTQMQALLAAIEIRAVMNIFNVTIANLSERICANSGITRGRIVYKEDKGSIYSEALNLAAHIAYKDPKNASIHITQEVYENIWPRAKRYFFRSPKFEGHAFYRFESIA